MTTFIERASNRHTQAVQGDIAWRQSVLSLPNAKGRERKAARMAELYSAGSTTLANIDHRLARLPYDEQPKGEQPKGNDDATLTRKVEIARAALTTRDDDDARRELKALNYAVTLKAGTPGISMRTALRAAGADTSKLYN